MTAYLDMNATTPVMKEVADLAYKLMVEDFGNAGSRTHEFGAKAKAEVLLSRKRVAAVVNADPNEIVFTSGATESNNIAILGLKAFGKENNKKHIITSKIEHKAVLEPIEQLAEEGFEVTYLNVGRDGSVNPKDLSNALREDTLMVSIMHVNNETGCIQPIGQICGVLEGHEAYLHVDAAQSFGKLSEDLKNSRIDFISASGHKLYAPKGIGALIVRRRGFAKAPLKPIMFGGGQEKGLRPGTLAVPLIAGFGLACELATQNSNEWQNHAKSLKGSLIVELERIGASFHGNNTSPFVLNFSVPGVNSESLMVSLKGVAAVSNGSACNSSSYTPSHVLTAMGLDSDQLLGAVRVSWGPMTDSIPIQEIIGSIEQVKF